MDPSSQGCPAATGIGSGPIPVNQPVDAAPMNPDPLSLLIRVGAPRRPITRATIRRTSDPVIVGGPSLLHGSLRGTVYPTGSIQIDRHVVVRVCAGEQQVLPARLIIILVLGLDDGRRPEFAGRDGAGIER